MRPGSTSSARRVDGIPNGVMLPTYLNNGYGFGPERGVLGPKFDPWQIKQDPNDPKFRIEEFAPPVGTDRSEARQSPLLDGRDRRADGIHGEGGTGRLGGAPGRGISPS